MKSYSVCSHPFLVGHSQRHLLRWRIVLIVMIFAPFLCSAQDQNALKEKLHTKQLAGTSADTMGYVEAFTEVKRLFIEGAFGEAWKAPYYWAPFVYYGQ